MSFNIFNKSGTVFFGGILITLFLSQPVAAQEIIWLSNSPPKAMQENIKESGMHRYSSMKGAKRGSKGKGGPKSNDKRKYKKNTTDSTSKKVNKKPKGSYKRPATKYVHWLRQGSSIEYSKYIQLSDSIDYQLIMKTPEGKNEPIEFINDRANYVKFELNEEGFHNVYLIIKKDKGDTLRINIAKAELLSHSCRNGHHKKLEARPVRYYPDITEFEMIRQRHPYEDYHFFTKSGDKETYITMMNGEPLSGVKVKLYTEKGWSNSFLTDEKGEVETEFIQDYFSKWKELKTRKIHYYMLQADYTLEKEVSYNGKAYKYVHYTQTMSDGYRPSTTMYASMVWGLVVFLITTILSIVGIYFYKERRKRPYKEIKFNESNS